MSFQPIAPRNTALTFGVEIEFCIASLDTGYEDPHPHAAPYFRDLHAHFNHPIVPEWYSINQPHDYQTWCVQFRIAEILENAGFPAVTLREIEFAEGRYPETERLARWVITSDSSIKDPKSAEDFKYWWYKIEINSPAYYYNEASVSKVKAVCALLSKTFRIHLNKSMGLHVHVGDGKKGFQADVLRTLMATLFVFEPQLNTLHPKNRSKNRYCRSLNAYTQLGAQSVFDKGSNPAPMTRAELLEKILGIGDRKILIVNAMMPRPQDSATHKLAYNVSNIMQNKQTIEFRQHESTLDPDRVGNWIATCVGLVELPFRESKEEIEALLRAHVNDDVEKFDVVKVLLALNLTAPAEYYDAIFHTLWIKNKKSLLLDVEDSGESGSEAFDFPEIDDDDDERL
jgi:hypothetical protein